MNETCSTCKHYYPTSNQCRRHAPAVALTHNPEWWDTSFPIVGGIDSCGDHQPREQPERWASVEIMGHQRLAGRLSVDYSTGHALTRVDVPEVTVTRIRRDYDEDLNCYMPVHRETYTIPDWFKLLGKGAIYAVMDTDRAGALAAAGNIQAAPPGWEPTDVRSVACPMERPVCDPGALGDHPCDSDGEDADNPRCRVCGCTDEHACPGGCAWVEDPEGGGDLCSACAKKPDAAQAPSGDFDDEHSDGFPGIGLTPAGQAEATPAEPEPRPCGCSGREMCVECTPF